MKLYELTAEYKNILDLIEIDDSEGLKLALEQLDGEIETKVENSVKVIKSIEGDILALKEEEKRLAGRRKALENKISSMKEYIEHNLISFHFIILLYHKKKLASMRTSN